GHAPRRDPPRTAPRAIRGKRAYANSVDNLGTLRTRLLALHKCLLDAERAAFTGRSGRVSATEFLQALTQDAALAWLSPVHTAIIRLDELLDAHAAGEEVDELADHLDSLRRLLDLESQALGERYAELVQSSPDVAYAHGALWHALRA